MKKTLVLVLSLLMVLSVASVASAELKIVGGQFSLQYTKDFDKEGWDDAAFKGVQGEARINLEGKYSADKFTGYAYSRFDFTGFSTGTGYQNVRWYMKKAEMDYIIADGLTIGMAYDEDDIKIHDELVYDGKKLKDIYKGTPLFSVKYAGDALKVSNFNTGFTGGLFDNLTVIKADIADAKVRSLVKLTQAKSGDESYLGFGVLAEASYNFGDFELGGGIDFGKAAVKDAEFEIANFRGAAKVYLGQLTLLGRVEMNNNTTEEKFELSKVHTIFTYGNYELETTIVPKSKIEPVLKFKKLAGTNNDIEAKLSWGYVAADEKFETKPALTVKHIFRF